MKTGTQERMAGTVGALVRASARAIGQQTLLLGLVAAIGFGFCPVATAAPAAAQPGPGGTPGLAEERVLFASDEMGWFNPRRDASSLTVRISPDGRRLLHSRPTAPLVEEGERGGTYGLWLREIDSGKDLHIPVPPYTPGSESVHIRFNPFAPDGTKMALNTRLDEGGSELVLFEIGKNTRTPTGIKARMALALFDWTGKRLVATAFGGQPPPHGMMTIDLPGFRRSKLDLGSSPRAYPTSVCPTADVISCFDVRPPMPGHRRGTPASVLCDMQNKEDAVELPTNEKNSQLDDMAPVWTSDGRYVCYCDQGTDPKLSKGTRIWDRIGKREMTFVPGTSPMGTGPNPSQIVLVSTQKGDNRGILLDVPSGKTWPLGDEKTRLLHAVKGKIAFLRFLAGEKMELRIATIVFRAPPQ